MKTAAVILLLGAACAVSTTIHLLRRRFCCEREVAPCYGKVVGLTSRNMMLVQDLISSYAFSPVTICIKRLLNEYKQLGLQTYLLSLPLKAITVILGSSLLIYSEETNTLLLTTTAIYSDVLWISGQKPAAKSSRTKASVQKVTGQKAS